MIKTWIKNCWTNGRWLLLIVAVGTLVRFYRLGDVPEGLNRDEAAIAYNAYLLWQTGHDEWQRVWPVFLASFGDYKLPGYPYTVWVLFNFIPVNDWTVRLPSALAGVGIIVLTYWLGQLLGKIYGWHQSKLVALAAAALVAISPIFIWYSRGAWEANVGLFWWLLAICLAARATVHFTKWSVRYLVLIFGILVISFLTYNSPLLITAVGLFFIPWWGWSRGKNFWGPLLVTVGAAVGATFLLLMPVTAQKNGITIFSDPTIYQHYVEYRTSLPGVAQKILGNRYLYNGYLVGKAALASFAPHFWLHGGTHPWHQLPGFGHLLYSQVIWWWLSAGLVLVELVIHWRQRTRWSSQWSSFGWWVLGLGLCLVPSVITVDSPHATRSLAFFYGLMWLMAAGLVVGRRRLVSRWPIFATQISQSMILGLFFGVMLLEGGYYYYHYQHDLPRLNIYHQGFDTAVAAVDQSKVILVKSPTEWPYEYIKLAWWQKMDPTLFWSSLIREEADPVGIMGVSDVANFHMVDALQNPPGNWQIIEYNTETNQWERVDD